MLVVAQMRCGHIISFQMFSVLGVGICFQLGRHACIAPVPCQQSTPFGALRIVKADGVDFLGAQPDQSLDLVISTFAVHFMDRERLDQD